MSKQDDERQVLNEFQAWSDSDRERTIEVFLQEREDRANTRRVADALRVLEDHIFNFEQQVTGGSALENNMLTALEGVRDVLVDDRPTIEVGSIAGPRRTALA